MLFQSNLMNIGRIGKLKDGGEKAAQTAKSTYWSCHDMPRTQNAKCSQWSDTVVGTKKGNHGPVLTRPKRRRNMSSLVNHPALVTRFGLFRGSWLVRGPWVQFRPGLQPGNLEPFLTLDMELTVQGISAAGFTYRSRIDWYISRGWVGWAVHT